MHPKEKCFGAFADNVPAMIWLSGLDGQRTYFNKRWLDFTGRPLQSQLQGGWMDAVHPDDVTRCLDSCSKSLDSRQEFRIEYRLRRNDGEYRWMRETCFPCREPDGSWTGFSGVCFDITESKAAIGALSRTTGRLVEAMDQERIRIAKELHDDIGSSLSILGIELMSADQPVSGSSRQKYPAMQELFRKLQEIGSKVSRLSDQLQPSMLKYFGLAKAVESECREFAGICRLPVTCSCNNIPPSPDPLVALSLFRALQEALSNAARHSRAAGIVVDLSGTSHELILIVTDDGAGFDPAQAWLSGGLGLISMRERMRRIGGALEITSQPGHGAKISCRAPLVPPV